VISDGGEPGDRGYATVWLVTAIAVVCVAAGVAVSVGVVTLERHRAAAAADAVALKVAMAAVQGTEVACRDGAAIGRLDGATLTGCRLSGSVASVEVTVRLPGPFARFGVATGRARAGPAGEAGVS
jgi:secretion/DNA translocation related TadE-like protein